MPKHNIDYSKTIMYKIVSKDLNNNYIYVGSTTNFMKRKYEHKASCFNENNKNHNYKVYKMIRENGGWDEFEMIEIEKYPCNDSNESAARERYWKEYFNANMNTQVPGIFNELGKIEYNKQYLNTNKAHIREYKNKKYNCICCGKYTYNNKAKHLNTPKHQNYLKSLFNNHDHYMKQIDNILDDIKIFINYLN
jgi:predicted GIY-YIG superfamily endonuclease